MKDDSRANEIAQFAEALVRFGGGDLAARAPRTSGDEDVDKLAFVINLTIDELAARLDESRRQLEALDARQHELEAANRRLTEAQEKLRHIGKLAALGEISAMLAHEVNQPLTAMVGHASVLLAPGQPPLTRQQREDVGAIKECAARIGGIIHNLTRFIRNDSVEAQATDPVAPLTSTMVLFRYQFEKLGIGHAVKEPGELPKVFIDAALTQQVFINLLANARDALVNQPPGSQMQVEVEVAEQRDAVCYLFRDSGPGILPDHRALIFEPFFTTKAGDNGAGLGLSLSRDIVARMGGTLELRPDDVQTCFAVRLPAATPPGA